MTKKGNLSEALSQFDRRPLEPLVLEIPEPPAKLNPSPAPGQAPKAQTRPRKAPAAEPAKLTRQPPSRQGKKALTGYFGPEVLKQLKVMAAANDTTIQALLTEALNDLFKKHGKPHIA